jgi:hypothetical protein
MAIQKLAALKHSDKFPFGTHDREAAYANATVGKVHYAVAALTRIADANILTNHSPEPELIKFIGSCAGNT